MEFLSQLHLDYLKDAELLICFFKMPNQIEIFKNIRNYFSLECLVPPMEFWYYGTRCAWWSSVALLPFSSHFVFALACLQSGLAFVYSFVLMRYLKIIHVLILINLNSFLLSFSLIRGLLRRLSLFCSHLISLLLGDLYGERIFSFIYTLSHISYFKLQQIKLNTITLFFCWTTIDFEVSSDALGNLINLL